MRQATPRLVLLAFLVTFVSAAAAPDARTEFTIESRLLERDTALYGQARDRERTAIREMRQLAEDVDRTIVDPNAALSTLRDLEAKLSAAREIAYLRAKETGEVRLRMYDRMERMGQLAQAVQRANPASLATGGGPAGLWQIGLEPLDTWGLMKLVVEGQLVTGSYRMSNGNRGSLRGTWSGGELDLEVIHSEQGLVGKLHGKLDDDFSLFGRWNATDVSSGQSAAGSWWAYPVTEDGSPDLGE